MSDEKEAAGAAAIAAERARQRRLWSLARTILKAQLEHDEEGA